MRENRGQTTIFLYKNVVCPLFSKNVVCPLFSPFYDPDARLLPSPSLIADYFSLTQAEAQLCVDFIAGRSLKEAAELR